MRVGPEVKKERPKFAMHFSIDFKPNPREISLEEENKLLDITSAILNTLQGPLLSKE
jgi:hypothetical protein